MPSLSVLGCCEALAERGWNIAFVESASAGRMCSEFALSPDSTKILRGGLFCYEVFVKQNILQIPAWIFDKFLPESAETTESLAIHGSAFFESDVIVAVTGILPSDGSQTEDRPIGTMFLHILHPNGAIIHQEIFAGSAEQIILATIDKAADLLTEVL